jgi:hypothetical protein
MAGNYIGGEIEYFDIRSIFCRARYSLDNTVLYQDIMFFKKSFASIIDPTCIDELMFIHYSMIH